MLGCGQKGEKETSSLNRLFITTSESPSRIKLVKPNSSAKEIALATAKASTMSDECGRLTYSESEAIACPEESRITTAKPAFPISLKIAPSKFTLSMFPSGGLHLI